MDGFFEEVFALFRTFLRNLFSLACILLGIVATAYSVWGIFVLLGLGYYVFGALAFCAFAFLCCCVVVYLKRREERSPHIRGSWSRYHTGPK